MSRAYLLLYVGENLTTNDVKDWADQSPIVSYWRYDMPNSIYLLSESNVAELSADFRRVLGLRGPYIVVEVGSQVAGAMLPQTWAILHDKKPLAHAAGEKSLHETGVN